MEGKDKCEFLKGIRKRMAEANGIPYESRECTFEGECSGTCPFCEKEAAEILSKLKERGDIIIKTDTETIATFEENNKMPDDYEVYVGSLVNGEDADSEIERIMKEANRPLMGDIDDKSYRKAREEEFIRWEKEKIKKESSFYNRKIKPFLDLLFGSPLKGEVEL